MRGLRASALAISTICRRDSARSLTSAIGWMSVAAGACERFLGDPPLRPPVDQSELQRRIADGDVVGDREIGDERQFLEDADDAGANGGGGRIEGDLRAVENDASGVRPDDAGKDLDQRRTCPRRSRRGWLGCARRRWKGWHFRGRAPRRSAWKRLPSGGSERRPQVASKPRSLARELQRPPQEGAASPFVSVSKLMDLMLRRPLRKQRASKDAPEGVYGAARRAWTVLRGPFGAPQDESGGLLKQALTCSPSSAP